jgi:hypothetical protein
MSASQICFTPRNLGEFLACERKLQEILAYVVSIWPATDILIGDIHRTEEEELAANGKSGIHMTGPPYRAIDVKVHNLLGSGQEWADTLGAKVNARYIYDPARPAMVVAYTAPHGTGPHLHLQVCAGTTRTTNTPLGSGGTA